MKKKPFLSNVQSRSWARRTQLENKASRLEVQVYNLEQQGFADMPETTGLPLQDRIRLLQEAKANAVKEIRSNIINAKATKGEDADLRVKAALNELEGKDLRALKKILSDIKKAKEDGESTEDLYSSLWKAMDASRAIDTGTEKTKTKTDNTPF